MFKKTALKTALVVAGFAAMPSAAYAESEFVTGAASPLTAFANLDFTITIPKFVYLRVGTGTALADNTTVDNLVFDVPATSIGDGNAVSATSGGDVSPGIVTARVLGNNGTIAFSSTTLGAMNNGVGDTISWSEMDVTVSTNTTATALSHPTLADGATTSINLPTIGGKVTVLDAEWEFEYANSNVVAAGTYGGVNTQNGRVTYAVSMP